MKTENVLNKDLAINELKSFLSDFLDKDFDIEKEYPKTLDALCSGRLVLDEKEPVYNLINPINEDTEFLTTSLTFKTRILPNTMASLAKGIDLKEDPVKYSLVCIAHIIGLASVKELDKFSKKDYNLIQELATVFM